MSFVRDILSCYRTLQYKICGRQTYGIMSPGKLCSHDPFEEDINHGDVVHPCVRYIEESYLGHKWWMVYTPYYAANDKTENPILCYAESNEPIPPIHWKFFCQVQGQPEKGYNSDPTLFYTDEKLYVMWRENHTIKCDEFNVVRATFGAEVKMNGIGSVFGPLVEAETENFDAEVSPTFYKDKIGNFHCLAMNLRFQPLWFMNLSPKLKKITKMLFRITDILGICSLQKSFGIAQWKSESVNGKYVLEKTIKFSNCNKLYRPWHMDFFEWNDKLYAIIQTNQCNADVCLAESEDGVHFKLFQQPLMTNKTCGKVGIYKPTGGIIGDRLYLYYTAQNPENRDLNQLFVTQIKYEHIISSRL